MQKKRLVVVIRGWTDGDEWFLFGRSQNSEAAVCRFAEQVRQLHSAEEVTPLTFNLSDPSISMRGFSTADPNDIVAHVLEQIDTACAETTFDHITIAGYSAGGLIARGVLVEANGIDPHGRFDPEARRDWAPKIDRWLSLSGILRGWTISSSMTLGGRLAGPALLAMVKFWGFLKNQRMPFISAVEHGMPFVVNTRLRLIALEREFTKGALAQAGEAPPLMVNVLGTEDEIITPSDCIEPSPRPWHVFLEVPGTTHLSILDISDQTREGAERRAIVQAACTEDVDALRQNKHYIAPDDLNDFFDELDRPAPDLFRAAADEVTHAVVVLHGIRDHGYWTKRIAKRIKAAARAAEDAHVQPLFRAPSPSYGYFTVLDFVNARRRKRQAHWLAAQYADIKSCFRNADVSFVGHSNGTYLIKQALVDCPAMHLKRVYFAGSVVRTDFRWCDMATQVEGPVVNMRAVGDRVVAFLPLTMQRLGLRWLDVGGAGYLGFNHPSQTPSLHQCTMKGNHTAGVAEPMWDQIADFVVQETMPPDPGAEPSPSMVWWQRWSPLWVLVAAYILLVVLFLIGFALDWVFGWLQPIVDIVFPSVIGLSLPVGVLLLVWLGFERVARRF